ncbi:MAG: 50S ribosomal protein L15 [Bacteroidales bacterium]|nr:50S ribosomal protein L15 [Bacteroidales bacterium]MCL2738093.1 50S ribosomal protein L15 [Bacteroidales bacterium]
MKLHNLKPSAGAINREKRIGRGEGSGHGGTSTRGHKGAQSRSGYSRKLGFEGGQMPLQRRLPKFGFNNINRVEYKAINISALQALHEKNGATEITVETLIESGLISKNDRVKILGNGVLSVKMNVTAHAFSKAAIAAIEAQEGTATKI